MTPTPPLINWHDDLLSVGISDMDDTHKEFIDLVNQLDRADDAQFTTLFEQLLAHTHAHFDRENALMAKSGFPPIHIHQGEHDRILNLFMQLHEQVEQNQLDEARQFIQQFIPEWFASHARTMDSALAWHLRHCGMAD